MSASFRTELPFLNFNHRISYSDKLLSLGSCFSVEIGKKLAFHQFNILVNPFGISYHPLPIIKQIECIMENRKFEKKDLFFFENQWHSFMHHGSYSDADATKMLEHIHWNIEQAHHALQNLNFLLITLGTAYAYVKIPEEIVVNNCHRIPSKNFSHRLYEWNMLKDEMQGVLQKLMSAYPNIRVILSVSPVRHKNISAMENNVSKSHLLLTSHYLAKTMENCFYFPAYELMLDDLRDYRFYAADMIHPNEQAVDYIFNYFKSSCIKKEEWAWMLKVAQIKKGLLHRPANAASKSHLAFLQHLKKEMLEVAATHPSISFKEELAQLDEATNQS